MRAGHAGSPLKKGKTVFVNTFWALVPPIVAIVLALITKETFSSLFIGILVGALLLTGFDPVATVTTIVNGEFGEGEDVVTTGLIPSVADNAGIFIFLVMLGIMVALVNTTGAASAFGKWAARNVKSRVGASLATFILGVLIFIDDYFNCLTVGSVMRPVTDEQKVSRAKLAYLIDATAAPICMIAPVSSWAAAVSGVAQSLPNVDGIGLFISAIPFNFYSLLTIVFVIVISVMGFDYGPMAKAELAAYQDGDLGSLGNDTPIENSKATMWDMLIPIVFLIIMCVCGLLFVGGFWGGMAGAIGMTLADLTTAYVTSAPKTFLLKLGIGLITGLLAHKVFHISHEKARQKLPLPAAVVLSSAGGMAFNIVADPLVGYFYKMYVLGVPQEVATIWAKMGAVTTAINALVAVVVASVLYLALQPALKRSRLLREI